MYHRHVPRGHVDSVDSVEGRTLEIRNVLPVSINHPYTTTTTSWSWHDCALFLVQEKLILVSLCQPDLIHQTRNILRHVACLSENKTIRCFFWLKATGFKAFFYSTQCLFHLTTGFTTIATERQSLRLHLSYVPTNGDTLIMPHQLTKPSAKMIENPAVFARIVKYLETIEADVAVPTSVIIKWYSWVG